MTALTEVARQLLADGQWHDLEKVLARLGSSVPPAKALREMERSRRKSARLRGLPEQDRVHARTDDRMVRSGQRRLALEALRRVGATLDPPATGGNRRVVGRRVRL